MYGAAFLAFLIVRIILAARSGETDPSLAVRGVFLAALRWVVGLVAIGIVVEQGALALLPVIAILLVPAAFIEHLLVPLGLPFLPYWLTRILRPWGARKENRAGAVCNEFRARLRRNVLIDPKRAADLAGPLLGVPGARGYSIAAAAILDALRGDLEQARALFNLGMDLRHGTYGVRGYCHAWLMADAARHGRYTELWALTGRGPFSMRRVFLRACAEHLLGLAPRSRLRLTLLWLASPGRAPALSLLRACGSRKALPLAPPLGRDFAAARDGAAELVSLPAGLVPRTRIREVAKAWQSIFDDGVLRRQLTQRMRELDSGFDLDQALAQLETQVIGIISSAWQAAPDDGRDEDDEEIFLMVAARDRAQDELLSELESLMDALEVGDAKSSGNVESLFRRWARIRWTAQRYIDLFPRRREFFYDNFGTALLNHGAWIHNAEQAHALSCDIFRWLRAMLPAGHEDLPLLQSNEQLSRAAADAP